MKNTNETYYKEIVKSQEVCISNKIILTSNTRECSHVLGLNAEPHIIYVNNLKNGKCNKSYAYGYIDIKAIYLDGKDGKKKLIQSYFPFGEELEFEKKSIDIRDVEAEVVCKNYKQFNNELLIYLILRIKYKVKIPIIIEEESCKEKPVANIQKSKFKSVEDIINEDNYEDIDLSCNKSEPWTYDSPVNNSEEIFLNNDYYDYLGGN